jgi:hypothetical protein
MIQSFGSESISSVDPDSESGSRSKRAKMTHKNKKRLGISCFEELDVLFDVYYVAYLLRPVFRISVHCL